MAEQTYHHGNLRDAFIEAALALEPEHGPLGLSLREVARKVGVTHAAAYHHFASKEALVLAVADDGY
ncbi:MAG: helix-turn-helix transcriptional regulator, partial [Gemmatimonadota bacterium]|nr:helix-turn-helix transcriptional regulator [Gemmatimonadota bacterium]